MTTRQEDTFNEIVKNEKTSRVEEILEILDNASGCLIDNDCLLYPWINTYENEKGEIERLAFMYDDDNLFFFCTQTQLEYATIDCGTLIIKGHRTYNAEFQEEFTITPLKRYTQKDWE
jgi:hypothetical protein